MHSDFARKLSAGLAKIAQQVSANVDSKNVDLKNADLKNVDLKNVGLNFVRDGGHCDGSIGMY